MKLSDENKQVSENRGNWFPFGVHKVQLMMFENGGTGDGEKEYIEVSFCDPEDGDKTDTARVWFTTDAAANYSFNTLRQIAVHNASEKNKDKARDAVDAVKDTTELCELLNEQLIGKEAWFTKYYDPSRTYVNQAGETKKSVNKNILGYEPKLKPELMPKPANEDGDPVTIEDLGGEELKGDAAKNIPESWA